LPINIQLRLIDSIWFNTFDVKYLARKKDVPHNHSLCAAVLVRLKNLSSI